MALSLAMTKAQIDAMRATRALGSASIEDGAMEFSRSPAPWAHTRHPQRQRSN
jgi:hypothetical protein